MFVLVDVNGKLLGHTDDAEEALVSHLDNPGSVVGRSAEITFNVPLPKSPARLNYIEAILDKHITGVTGIPADARDVRDLAEMIHGAHPHAAFYPDKKIQAIKEVRSVIRISLAEAKAVVDRSFSDWDDWHRTAGT